MRYLIFTISVLLGVTSYSCKTPIDIPYNIAQQDLTVLCIAETSAPQHEIRVSRTHIGSFTPMNASTIDFSLDGVPLGTTKLEKSPRAGVYTLHQEFRPKQQLKLKLKEGEQTVYAEAIFPETPSLGACSVEVYDTPTRYGGTNRRAKWSIKLQDSPEGKDYYRIAIWEQVIYKDKQGGKLVKIGKPVRLSLNGESDFILTEGKPKNTSNVEGSFDLDEIFGQTLGNPYNIFSDQFFNGRETTIEPTSQGLPYRDAEHTARFAGGEYKDRDLEYVHHQYTIQLQALSEDTYFYYRSLGQSRTSDDESGFSVPVQIHSNIRGGVGILGAITSSYRVLYKRFVTKNSGS